MNLSDEAVKLLELKRDVNQGEKEGQRGWRGGWLSAPADARCVPSGSVTAGNSAGRFRLRTAPHSVPGSSMTVQKKHPGSDM